MVSSICQVGISREENSYFSSIILTPSNVFELNIKYFLSRRKRKCSGGKMALFWVKSDICFFLFKNIYRRNPF